MDLYAQLLASAVQNRADGHEIHPAFVEVLKQCSPDDASILNILYLKLAPPFLLVEITSTDGLRTTLEKRFTTLAKESGVENLRRVRIAIDNLTRLGLVDAIEGSTMPDDSLYDDLETLAVGDSELGATEDRAIPLKQLQFTRGAIVLRDFGLEFCRAFMDEVGLEQRVSLRVKGPEIAAGSPTAPYLMIIIPQITPLRVSGLTELVGDIRLRVVGELRDEEKITIKFWLNTNITSRLEKDPWSEAAIYVGRERVKLAQGRQIGPNALLFENVDLRLVAYLPISERYLTISGVRCNANQIGFGNNPRIEAFLEVNGMEIRSFPQHNLARIVEDHSVALYSDPSCTFSRIPVLSLSAPHNAKLLCKSGGVGIADVFIKVSNLFELESASGDLPSSEQLRLILRFNNVPRGASLFAVITGIDESAHDVLAELIETDANGAGRDYGRLNGTHFLCVDDFSYPCRPLVISGEYGSTIATYALALPSSKYSSVVLAIAVAFETKPELALPGLGTGMLNVGLAPLSTVSTSSATAPIPRFCDRSRCMDIFRIDL